MKQLGKVRRLCYRQGLSISDISRQCCLSRNTVKRWLKSPDGRRAHSIQHLPETADFAGEPDAGDVTDHSKPPCLLLGHGRATCNL